MSKSEKSNNQQTERHKILKRYIIALWIMGVASAASLALSVYTYVSMPKSVESYVNAHKDELKGEKGDRGDIGPQGFNGVNGSNGSSGNANQPLSCTNSYYGGYSSYTTCY